MTHPFGTILPAGIFSLCLAPAVAQNALTTMNDVGAAIMQCWSAPSGVEGSFVTLSFSFRRDGTLLGRPRATGVEVEGDDEARKRFVDSAIAAVEDCTPLNLSPALAEGIGGKVFTMRFPGDRREVREARPTN